MPIHSRFILDNNNQPSAQGLVLAGPFLEVEIHIHPALAQHLQKQQPPQALPTPVVGRGLIDTGATFTGIHRDIATQLNIAPVDTIQSGTAGGQQVLSRYPIRLAFPGSGIPDIALPRAVGVDLTGQGFIALIGRDILAQFVLTYIGPLGQIVLGF